MGPSLGIGGHALYLLQSMHACAPDRPELIHPFASAIDEPELTAPEVMVSTMIDILSRTLRFTLR